LYFGAKIFDCQFEQVKLDEWLPVTSTPQTNFTWMIGKAVLLSDLKHRLWA
jgi:hypothetical protein